MITTFRTLCTLGVTHTYYSEGCRDFRFAVPAETEGVLRNGKLLAKTRDGVLHILFEADEAGQPLRPLAGARLRFGLRLRNPLFAQGTGPLPAATPLYRNDALPAALDPPLPVRLTGALFHHDCARPERPVTLTLRAASGLEVAAATITAAHNRQNQSFDLSGEAPGLYRLEERYPGESLATAYYLDPELQRTGVFGLVEIAIASTMYTAPPALTIPFAAKEERLNYYLVVGNYTAAEFKGLMVADHGFAEENRPQILFDRLDAPAFTGHELSPALLARGGEEVVLFRSRVPVARRERARRNIQLRKHGDVLIKHLPQAGAADAQGDVVIHISKP